MSQAAPTTNPLRVRDDLAYMLPMIVFLLFVFIAGQWSVLHTASYILKALLVAALLIVLWPSFTRITWNHWFLGILVGILGVVQWIGMEELLLRYVGDYHFSSSTAFDPFKEFSTPARAWSFIALRFATAVLIVPVMEELFWRDFLWRNIIAPNDFKLAQIGEWDSKAFFIVAACFAAVHFEWLTAFAWGLMIGGLLLYTRSIGACIIAHALTNFLLYLYILYTHDWRYW